jgi:hypothetical protein
MWQYGSIFLSTWTLDGAECKLANRSLFLACVPEMENILSNFLNISLFFFLEHQAVDIPETK